jgi:hypothetical protein
MTEWKNDLHETNKLIREVILPHMIKLEIELQSLRKHTWPYVQSKKEKSQLDDIEQKRDFLQNLDDETIIELLNIKSKLSKNSGFQGREYDIITSKKYIDQ